MTTATFLTIILIILSLVLIVVGIYAILVLVEARESLRRTNRILTKADSLIEFVERNILRPSSSVSVYLSVFKQVLDLIAKLKTTSKKTGASDAGEE